jgi:hypothetical protein
MLEQRKSGLARVKPAEKKKKKKPTTNQGEIFTEDRICLSVSFLAVLWFEHRVL